MPTTQRDALSTDPFEIYMAAGQREVVSTDMAPLLAAGESFTEASTTLRNLATDAIDADLPAPTVSVSSILQVVDGGVIGFVKGEVYEMVLYAHVSATRRPAKRVYIRVLA